MPASCLATDPRTGYPAATAVSVHTPDPSGSRSTAPGAHGCPAVRVGDNVWAVMVLSICSLKGGVGKTSVVLGLASAALSREIPTLVIDLDPQADATVGLNVIDEQPTSVVDLLRHPRRRPISQLAVASGWTGSTTGRLDVVPGSEAGAALDGPPDGERGLGRVRRALEKADDYRLVLLDCPPSFGTLTRNALVASRRALVVSEPGLFSVTAADRALRAIDSLRRSSAPQLQPLGVLVNRFRDRSPEHRFRVGELTDMFGPLVLTPALPERSALQQAQGASQPIHEWPGPAARELADAFDHHLARVLRVGSRQPKRRTA